MQERPAELLLSIALALAGLLSGPVVRLQRQLAGDLLCWKRLGLS